MDQTPEEMVKTFAAKGWPYLEMSTEHAATLIARGDAARTGASFRRYAGDNGVTFPQGHLELGCDIAGPEAERWVETLKKWIDLFVALGIRAAVLHPGKGDTPADAERRIRSLRILTQQVRGTDTVLCLENMPPGYRGRTAEDLRDIIRDAGETGLAICLDTGHLNIGGGDQAAFIRCAGPLLKALHIADNEGTSDQHLIPFGRGTVDWAVVKRELLALRYNGLYNFEVPGERRCPLSVRLAKLDYLKAILPVLMGG